jgi:hypothetical protein
MNLVPYVLAGLVGGILMGFVSEIGFRRKIFQLGLISADGAFGAKMLGLKGEPKVIYGLGIPIHLATGMAFGLGYGVLCLVFALDPHALSNLVIYTFFLWLCMLLIALPLAGQGFLGNKAGRRVWWEQILVHIMFGAGFWWGL